MVGVERFISVYVRIYCVCVVILFAFSRTEGLIAGSEHSITHLVMLLS
jgi:hypothetical protein